MKKAIIAYVPVLHEGYRIFFEKHAKEGDLFLLGNELIKKFTHLAKEIRQLDPELIKKAIESWGVLSQVSVLDEKKLVGIAESGQCIIMPDEDIMLDLRSRYFPNNAVLLDNIFLRWDKHNTVAENHLNPDVKISDTEFDKKIMALVDEEAKKSSDWWRRIGCVIIKDEKVFLVAHNKHLPSDHTPYVNGDPRNNFHKGVHLELGTSIHSEAGIIAEAARQGVSLNGTEVYVTTFPCPPCAKLIACSGISKLYYRVGYGVLDAENILKQSGVEIIRVEE